MISSEEEKYLLNVKKEQREVQTVKIKNRLLDSYNAYIFNKFSYSNKNIFAFFEKLLKLEVRSVIELVQAIYRNKKSPVHWVDMGCGNALALRQIKIPSSNLTAPLHTTGIDLFDYNLSDLDKKDLEKRHPGITNQRYKPKIIHTNIESVRLSDKADLITAIESIQYLNDPITAICNWYNALNDNGILIISTEQSFSRWIAYTNLIWASDPTPITPILETLGKNGIEFITNSNRASSEYDQEFSTIIIKKKPNTLLKINTHLVSIRENLHHYKTAYYYLIDQPIIVINGRDAPGPTQRYYKMLNDILSGSFYGN